MTRRTYEWPCFAIVHETEAREARARFARRTLADLAELEQAQAERRAERKRREYSGAAEIMFGETPSPHCRALGWE